MIAIISDENVIGKQLYESLKLDDEDIVYHNIVNQDISTCMGCDYCYSKSFLECVIKDDMQGLYSDLLEANLLVLTGPVCFGSYSEKIKKMLDRMVVLGDIRYGFDGKEVTANFQNKEQHVYFMAVDVAAEDKPVIDYLVTQNHIITQNQFTCHFVSSNDDIAALKEVVKNGSVDYFSKS